MPKEDNQPLTLKHFQGFKKQLDKRFDGIRKEFKADLDKGLEGLAKIFSKEITRIDKRFEELINSLDGYIKKVEGWHDESMILAARIEKMQRALIAKGIVTKKELSL